MPSTEEQAMPPTAPTLPQASAQRASHAQIPQQYVQSAQNYPPQPQQYANLESLVPPPPFSRPWHVAKLVLGGASIVCSTVLISLGIAIAVLYSDSSWAIADVIEAAVVAGIALGWQIAENVTICARSVHRGIHPGAHVGLHLIIWIGAVLSTVFTGIFLAEDASELSDSGDWGYSSYYSYGYNLSSADGRTYVGIEGAMVGFFGILTIIHFVLFVRACIETHQRNKLPRTLVLIPQGAQIPASNNQVYYMPMPPEAARNSYMQPQQQMQQMPMQSVYPNQVSGQGYYAPPGASPPGTDPNGHGYYSPATAHHQGFSPATGRSGSQSRPESSVVSPSPVSEARQLDKGKGPEIVPEQGEASGSGSHAI